MQPKVRLLAVASGIAALALQARAGAPADGANFATRLRVVQEQAVALHLRPAAAQTDATPTPWNDFSNYGGGY